MSAKTAKEVVAVNRLPPPDPRSAAVTVSEEMTEKIWHLVKCSMGWQELVDLGPLGMDGWRMAVRPTVSLYVIEMHYWPPGIEPDPRDTSPGIRRHGVLDSGILVFLDLKDPTKQEMVWRVDVPRTPEHKSVCAAMTVATIRGAHGMLDEYAGLATYHHTTWK